MTAFSYTAARKNLKSVFTLAVESLEEVLITQRNGKNVVIFSEEEFLSWKETIHLMKNPNNALHLQQSLQEKAEGKIKVFGLSDL